MELDTEQNFRGYQTQSTNDSWWKISILHSRLLIKFQIKFRVVGLTANLASVNLFAELSPFTHLFLAAGLK